MTSAHESGFTGKFAIVTGSTQGIGEATARHFARRGAAGLVICGRNADRGHTIARELNDRGCITHYVAADLQQVDACREVVDTAVLQFERIDVLVNCAGWAHRGTLDETTPELWDRVFAVNARAPFLLMQSVAAVMRSTSTHGTMVNVISMASHGGTRDLTAYAAAKGALATLTRNVAWGLIENRIRVNGLNIGWTNTPGEEEVVQTWYGGGPGWLEEASRRQPFGRLIEPDDVARAIAFLASDESGVMTGSIVDYDQVIVGTRPSREPFEARQ